MNNVFDSEASPAMLSDAGLDWRTWAYAVAAVVCLALAMGAAFVLGHEWKQEAWESVHQVQRGE